MKESFIPLLFENAVSPIMLETGIDLSKAINIHPFMRSNRMEARTAIIKALKLYDGHPIECYDDGEIFDKIPSDCKHKLNIVGTYTLPTDEFIDSSFMKFDMLNGARLDEQMISSFNDECMKIYTKRELMSKEMLINVNLKLLETIKHCDAINNHGFLSHIYNEAAYVNDVINSIIEIKVVQEDIRPIISNVCSRLKYLKAYVFIMIAIFEAEYKERDMGDLVYELSDIAILLKSGSDINTTKDVRLAFTCSDRLELVRKQNTSILSMTELWEEKMKMYTSEYGKEYVNNTIMELQDSISLKGLNYLSNGSKFASLEDLLISGYPFKYDVYKCRTAEGDYAYLMDRDGCVCLIVIDRKGERSCIHVCHLEQLEHHTINNLCCFERNNKPFKRSDLMTSAMMEAASLDINKRGDITIKQDRFISPMDNYANLHEQLVLANNSKNPEEMKVVLSAMLYNLTKLDKDYHELKNRKSESSKFKEIQRARMFFRNDFAQYYPKYLKYETEPDFINYYGDMGLNNKEYTITADKVRGVKNLISAVIN